jgi:hypothetical protein
MFISVAKGPKLRPQHKKGDEKSSWGPENLGLIFPWFAKKGPTFFEVLLFTKTASFIIKSYFTTGLLNFSPTILHRKSLKKSILFAPISKFSERPNFFAGGQTYWLIGQKILEISWQHWYIWIYAGRIQITFLLIYLMSAIGLAKRHILSSAAV